jgi:tRNA nucleotidyltransferase/poly(A) polymerase
MTTRDPTLAREFAVEVVRKLRAEGHQALWAGGCVRDQLLGLTPKDYDVATDAVPERIREIFGKKRTLAIGAAFGVITAIGPRGAGQIDVATFRRDATYSDGRHPDAVSYSDPEHDAERRDFTINGLFFDPITEQVIDYVGGQHDLEQRVIRAIGDPLARIAEDKLRMLRAVRFAARFGFAIDPATREAIEQQARELVIVSAERVAAELRMILTHDSRAAGVRLLAETGLLEVVLPETRVVLQAEAPSPPAPLPRGERGETEHPHPGPLPEGEGAVGSPWSRTLRILAALESPTFAVALAALLREIEPLDRTIRDLPRTIFERWKLSNDELEGALKLLAEEPLIRQASHFPWPRVQRILTAPRIEELLGYAAAVAVGLGDAESREQVAFCRAKLALPPEELNPPPLITGADLKPLGIPPGPAYRELLEAARDAQLDRRLTTQAEALALVRSLWEASR